MCSAVEWQLQLQLLALRVMRGVVRLVGLIRSAAAVHMMGWEAWW